MIYFANAHHKNEDYAKSSLSKQWVMCRCRLCRDLMQFCTISTLIFLHFLCGGNRKSAEQQREGRAAVTLQPLSLCEARKFN